MRAAASPRAAQCKEDPMSNPTQTTKPALPPVKGGLTPYLQADGAAKAADFYIKAFGATEAFRYPVDDKGRTMHIHLYVNGSSLMLSDAYPDHGHPHRPAQGYTLTLHLGADEVDAWWNRAVDAGADDPDAAAADVLGRPLWRSRGPVRRRSGR